MNEPEKFQILRSDDIQMRILTSSLLLFTKSGIASVSFSDIALASATDVTTVTHLYSTKEELVEDVFRVFTETYIEYMDTIEERLMESTKLECSLDILFDRELSNRYFPEMHLFMSLAVREQHSCSLAKKCVEELFLGYSVEIIKAGFDRLASIHIIPVSYTEIAAIQYMIWMFGWNDMYLHKYFNSQLHIDTDLIYHDMYHKCTCILSRGI